MPRLLRTVADTGVCVAALRDSHRFSALWPDLEPLGDRGLVALTAAAGEARVVPPGGRVPVFGTNPFAFDFPDSAMSNGDTRIAGREGRTMPPGTGIDRDGQPTTDPNAILDGGALLPFGGFKDLALSLMVELLASTPTGGSFSSAVNYGTHPGAGTPRTGQLLIMIDPARGATRAYATRAGISSRAGSRCPEGPKPMTTRDSALSILAGEAVGPVLHLTEPLSFWGGVDPATSAVIDTRHPQHGARLTGAIVLMPTTRGSCSGSGVVLEMALAGLAPAALVFAEAEDVATLGALVASEMFGRPLPVLRLGQAAFDALSRAGSARIDATAIRADGLSIPVAPAPALQLDLDARDRAMLEGSEGEAAAQAMRILVAMARQQGAARLIDVTRAHIDGCIYAGPANLVFAEAMEAKGARVRVPTSMNAISVDREGWQRQAVPRDFGEPASRLADAYVRMGCRATFTCAPYLLDDAPGEGEPIGWSESNAVIFANSVLGARTAKHPDFLDLCIAITGRAPLTGPFLDDERRAGIVIDVDLPDGTDAAAWPLIGYLAGSLAPDRIPLLRGLAKGAPTRDDLKALCAAFGTTSAAPMLNVEGVTPEAEGAALPDATRAVITRADLVAGWRRLNDGPEMVDLVAIGSPHASHAECRALAATLDGQARTPSVAAIVTVGRQVLAEAERDGTRRALAISGVEMIPDLCWCSISRPVFPPHARTVITTSGKYAHYGPGLSGCAVRLGTLADCVDALLSGRAPARLPGWLT